MGRNTKIPSFSRLFLTLLAGFTSLAQCDGPLVLQQRLLSINSTDTHAVPATFGNPPRTINLIISTTSDRSWVYSPSFCESLPSGLIRAACESSITGGGARQATSLFNPTDSNTWKQVAADFQYTGPNNQQQFTGLRGTDKLAIEGIEIPEFEFGVITGTDIDDASVISTAGLDGGIGGVLGLGGNSNFLKFLVDQGIIKSSSIGVQLASKVIFEDAENVEAYPARRIVPFGTEEKAFPGNIVLGGYDAQKLDNEATPADGLTSQNEIQMTLTQFTSTWFDGASTNVVEETIEYQATAANGGEDENSEPAGIQAVIDSTSPFILLPRSLWDGGMSGRWNRGDVNETTGRAYYTGDLSGFRDWRNFTFHLVSKDGAKSQVVMQHFDWNIWDPEAQFWAPAFKLQPEGVETIVLGRPAMRALYIAVDWDTREAKTQPLKKRTTEKVEIVEVVSGGGLQVQRRDSLVVVIMMAAVTAVVAGGGLHLF